MKFKVSLIFCLYYKKWNLVSKFWSQFDISLIPHLIQTEEFYCCFFDVESQCQWIVWINKFQILIWSISSSTTIGHSDKNNWEPNDNRKKVDNRMPCLNWKKSLLKICLRLIQAMYPISTFSYDWHNHNLSLNAYNQNKQLSDEKIFFSTFSSVLHNFCFFSN